MVDMNRRLHSRILVTWHIKNRRLVDSWSDYLRTEETKPIFYKS